jgi:hypothetical protein
VGRILEQQNKRIAYEDLLKRLEIPEDAPTTKKCASCGQDMHMVKMNRYVTFMVHSPEQQPICAASNPTGVNSPLIWCNKHLIRNKLDAYYEEVTGCKAKQ